LFLEKRRKDTPSPHKILRERRDTKADDKKSKSIQKHSSGLSVNKNRAELTTTYKNEKRIAESRKPELGKRSSASIS